MNHLFEYFLALLIGVSLGLIGAGGSILTVPVLVYAAGIEPVIATAYSLFIVGCTALIGAGNYYRKGLLDFKTAFIFATPSIIAVFLIRKFVIHAIPKIILTSGHIVITREILLMCFFALIMLIAAIRMILVGRQESREGETPVQSGDFNYTLIFAQGFGIGILTGLAGIGGGFLITPALVIIARLPMRLAIGTSLLVIALNSLIGFLGDVMNITEIRWEFLFLFVGIASVGLFIGTYLGNYIKASGLKRIFGWFVLIMGIYIMYKELQPLLF